MKQKPYLMGIDPDIQYCGYAIYNKETETLFDYGVKDFWALLDCIKNYKDEAVIVVEGGWLLRKKNWHTSGNQGVGERVAYDVGRNHCIGQLIVQFCERNGIECIVVKPKGKIDKKLFTKFTNIKDKVNQDVMDAVMLVYKSNL